MQCHYIYRLHVPICIMTLHVYTGRSNQRPGRASVASLDYLNDAFFKHKRFMRFGKSFTRKRRTGPGADGGGSSHDDEPIHATDVVCFGDNYLSREMEKRFMRFGK